MAQRLLIVEDEADLAAIVADSAAAAGCEATCIAAGRAALAQLRTALPDLVVLDIQLPGMDGLSLCRAVRGFSDVPIVMVTARVEEIDRLLGLDAGADDYVCKPFSPRELIARIRAILRRPRLAAEALRPIVVDEAARNVRIHGQPLDLTRTEFDLFAAMARRPGTIFSRAQLLDVARGENLDVTDRAIDSHVKNLRRKIAAAWPGEEVIHSVYGLGYRVET